MIVKKGIMIRVKPNAAQRELLAKHFGANRWLWNYFLNKRKTEYAENKLSSTYIRDCAELTKLKQSDEYKWLYEVSVGSQQRTLKHLDDAYKRFFKGKAKFPKFKSKRHEQVFTLANRIKIKGNRICFQKFRDGLKFNRTLPAFTKINSITVRKTASGKYYAILSVEAEVFEKPKTGKSVGIDLGLADFAVFSNGKRIKAPKHFCQQQAALKRAQQHLSRKQKGSKRREKQRIKVARIHEQIANARRDFLHKASAFAVENFDVICVEDLAVKNLMQNRKLSKAIGDASWSAFLTMLAYKAEWYEKALVKVGRFYPSSKACHTCGWINQGLRLDQREWMCPHCGAVHDRDLNAAKNILVEGLKQLSARQSPSTIAEAA